MKDNTNDPRVEDWAEDRVVARLALEARAAIIRDDHMTAMERVHDMRFYRRELMLSRETEARFN